MDKSVLNFGKRLSDKLGWKLLVLIKKPVCLIHHHLTIDNRQPEQQPEQHSEETEETEETEPRLPAHLPIGEVNEALFAWMRGAYQRASIVEGSGGLAAPRNSPKRIHNGPREENGRRTSRHDRPVT